MIYVNKYDAFYFDFDGVLADSVEVKTDAFAKMFESYGSKIRHRVIDHHRENGGMPRKEKFKHYYDKFLKEPIDDKQIDELCNRFSSLVVKAVINAPEIPGAQDFLEKWHQKVSCFVVSATPDEEIQYIVKKRGLGNLFQEVLGSNRSKTGNLKYLLKKYGLDNTRGLFFGDAESDYIAAKNCAVSFIGILDSPHAPLFCAVKHLKWYPNFLELKEKNIDDL